VVKKFAWVWKVRIRADCTPSFIDLLAWKLFKLRGPKSMLRKFKVFLRLILPATVDKDYDECL
jgi:hypothetical protein